MAVPHDDRSDNLLDHAQSPFHCGVLSEASDSHLARNPSCGDEILLQLRIAGSQISAAWFQGRGCLVSQAGASMLCERIDGSPLEEVRLLTEQDVLDCIGVPLNPVRRHCGLLAFRALQQILANRAS